MFSLIVIFFIIFVGLLWHEIGHLTSAKKNHIKVLYFSLGFGNTIFSKKGKDDTVFRLKILPFGGSVNIDEQDLNSASLRKNIKITLAGVARNFLLAGICIFLGYFFISNTNICDAFKNTITIFFHSIKIFYSAIFDLFNPFKMASYGGIVTQSSSIGTFFNLSKLTSIQELGYGLMIGGMCNIVIGLFNLLPIPCLDGGQVLISILSSICKKNNIPFDEKKADKLSYLSFKIMLGYQIFLILLDIPFFRNLFY